MYRILPALLIGLFFTAPAMAVPCRLASGDKAAHPIIIAPAASESVKALAAELADYLKRISGAAFEVKEGDGSAGIVLGLAKDFPKLPFRQTFENSPFAREHYLLRSHAKGLYLLGATDAAVSHAAWDFLHRLGYRQFFPGEVWEHIPAITELKIDLDTLAKPDFYARNIWYNWGMWGYNNEPYRDWCQRNRMAKGFDLQSGHSYEAIMAANREAFEQHPEYFAVLDGRRTTDWGGQKFCLSNPALRKLVVDYAVRQFKENPTRDSISMDPSDGGGWCQCEACVKIGGPSDRVILLANQVAEAINKIGLGEKIVGFYAYNEHSIPPKGRVSKYCIPSVTTAFLHGGLSFDQTLSGWQGRGAARIGTYDYLSVVAWDWNMPRAGKGSQVTHLGEFIPHLHRHGVRFYDAESGDCWGPCGLGYYFASRVLWDIGEAENREAIVEDFLTKCFGDAREPMREFYRLITDDNQRRSASDLLGRMYRQLDAAKKATSDPKVHRRLDDLILYTRYAELYANFSVRGGSLDDVVRHAFRMRKTMMIHAYGLLCRLIGQGEALREDHPLKSDAPFTAEELAVMLKNGIANNEPVELGFESVAFSKNLAPAAQRLELPETPAGYFPTESQGEQEYYIWVPEGVREVKLEVTVHPLWRNKASKVALYSPKDVTITVLAEQEYPADGQPHTVTLRTPYDGLHRVRFEDGGDFTKVKWPEGWAVTVETDMDSPHVGSHFRGNWTLYFYVPKGTKKIGGWASRIADWAPRTCGTLIDPEGNPRHDFGQHEEGWFSVDVPEGMDGKLWKFQDNNGQRLLMTVPPYMARSAAELLLPVEVE